MIFEAGQKVKISVTNVYDLRMVGWEKGCPTETEVLGYVNDDRRVVVFKPRKFGGYALELNNGRLVEEGYKVDARYLSMLEDIKPIIPYTRVCQCGMPARKTKLGIFCSNKRCKSRKPFSYFGNYKHPDEVDSDNFLICLECQNKITNVAIKTRFNYQANEYILSCPLFQHWQIHSFKLGEKIMISNSKYVICEFDPKNRIYVQQLDGNNEPWGDYVYLI